MKATAPEALKALASLGEAYAVIYLPGDTVPVPLTVAGAFRGRPFFMLGVVGHWIGDDLEAVVKPSGIEYRDALGMRYFVTPASNAPEVQQGLIIQAIETSRQQLETGWGMAAAILALDPLGESPEAPAPADA